MSLKQILDLIETEAQLGLPDELANDLESACISIRDHLRENGEPRENQPQPAEKPGGAIGVYADEEGGLSVRAKTPHYEAYARTLQDLLNLLQGRPIGGLASALMEIAARVDALETQAREALRAQRRHE